MNERSSRISTLSDEQRKLLALRLHGKRTGQSISTAIIPRRAGQNVYLPLSYAQQRLWFLNELEPESSWYNTFAALRLTGPIQSEAMEKSFNAIVERHEILRSSYRIVDGQPVQKIEPRVYVHLPVIDLQMLPVEKRLQEAIRLSEEDVKKPFDLSKGPLIRVSLIRLNPEDHLLLLNMHHIVSDGWSVGVLVREMTALYESFCTGRPSPLPELPIQYPDFAIWQREQFQGTELGKQIAYWKERLSGELPVLEIPTDRPRPKMQTFNGARYWMPLDERLMENLKRLSRKENVTLFMTFLAAYKLLLSRYTGLEDILVGSPVANRPRVETEGLIGVFVNTLVLRTDLTGNPTFREFLQRVRLTALGAYEHQDLPFEKLVEVLQPNRNLSHSPFFQTMFILNEPHAQTKSNNLTDLTVEKLGLRITPIEIDNKTAKFDLTINVDQRPDGWLCMVEYNTDLFDQQTIQRLVHQYRYLLEQIVHEPDKKLSEYSLLTKEEAVQLEAWRNTETDDDLSVCLPELFAAHVEKAPHELKVVGRDGSLTMRELDKRANQVAHYLKQHGVGPGVLVGLCINRSLDMVVGLLGILKAGGAFVPIDPSYPIDRIAYMVEQSGMPIVLTEQLLIQGLSALQVKLICVDAEAETIASFSSDAPTFQATKDDPVYVIYTSGSTGKPKGVQIKHESLTNVLLSMKRLHSPSKEDRLLAVTTISFDISIIEIFLPLITDMLLVIATKEEASDGQALIDLLNRHQITILQATPSTFRMLLEAGWSNKNLRKVVIGGEALPRDLATSLLRQGVEVWNQYGPTETTIWVTCDRVENSDRITIGRPIQNTETYVLDAHFNQVPIGVPGELYIGGKGLALGYLNRMDLTLEKFLPHPFSKEEGARLYRTGDLVRYLSDGKIEYLGRIDQQVKVRGFRIELGEIEAVLETHPYVKQAVAVVHDGHPGDKRLVAYVTTNNNAPVIHDLYVHLRKTLPEYMIPSTIMILDAIPLTPNGKVDRKVLPAPEFNRRNLDVEFVAPRNELEEQVAMVWKEVLHQDEIGIQDNFFELGGHSILITQVIARLKNLYEVEIPLRHFFANPTIEGIAEFICSQIERKGHVDASEVKIGSTLKTVLASVSQKRLRFLEQFTPNSQQSILTFGIRLSGNLEIEAFERSIHELVRRHESLRTRLVEQDGELLQEILDEVVLPFTMYDLRNEPTQEEVANMLLQQLQRELEPAKGVMLKTMLLRTKDQEHLAMFAVHRLAADEGSLAVMLDELATLYSLASKGMNFSLPSPSAQFSDFVLEQVERMPEIDQQFAYWENQLSGVHSVLSLPTDRPRPPIQTTNGGEVVFEIPSDVYEALKILSERQGVERYTVLFAAYVTLLHRYTGQEDILIGMKADSREEKWNHVIGPIENTLVLRANLTTGLTVSNLLHKCQILVDEARKNREVPFETILERLHLERDTSRHPLFQATFELRSESPKLEAEGVRMELVEPVRRFTHYDLTLVLKEQKDGCSGKFVYNADLFDASMISRMAGHFLTILDSIIENPLQKMSKLKMLSEEELQIILAEWKQEAQTDVLQEVCVHHLIEKQAQMTPHAVAVKYRDKELTYEELNERSSRLANYLRKLGVGANSLVGISVERSLEMVIGLLGILKAGGAYLPLDPAYPSDRLAFMLQDSKVGVLLTQERLQGKLPTFNGKIVCLDADWGDIVQEPELPCNSKVGPDDLMYVMYTSGSTGTPKGVMISHRGVVNHNLAVVRHFDLNGNDRVLQFASISFDIAVEEIFPTLIVGGTLVLWKDLHVAGGEEFLHWIDKVKITVLNLPTAYWHGWVHDLALLGSSLPPSVRLVVVGGEKASAETYVDWLKLAAHRVRWVNTYGPTEATVTATLYEPDKEYKDGNPIPIGRPLDNVQIYVLDTQMNPVPIGVPGELYIGGPGVARGYLNRPDLTDERFVGNPFASQTGERLFKTGDIVRYLPDGNLEFVCRMDNQVKIRGYRIELGEIEAVLEQNSQVSQAVVIVREDAPGIKQLTAYVVASPSTTDVIDLRDFAKSRLPEYMVPTSFVLLDQLPMTPNGKIDYKRLPEAKSMPVDEEAIVAPRNLIEEMVAQIWKDVLRKECVSMFDNFFHLGGHSLLAAQVMTRLRSQFKVEISMARFFNNPTVADLATEVDRALKEQKQNGDLPIIRVSRHGKLPLSFSQRRLWFLCQLEPERMHYNIPMAVRLRGNLNLDAFHRSLNEIVRRHESLRTVFRVEDGEPYQVVLEKLELPLPVIDLRHMEPEERSEEAMRLINVWAQELFNLEQGPLLKVNMIRLDDEEFVVMFNIHHIVSDGWSTSLIIREMSILYEAYCQGRPSPLEELSIQYADYAFWQRTRIQGEYLESQMNYWRKVLGGDLPVLQLPTDRPRPPVMSHRGKLISFKISKELNDKLKAFSRENGVTLFMTLLSAYQLLLYRYSGQEDICVGTPIAVRNRPEMEGLIGFFVNTLVIRTDLSGEPTFLDLLDRVREVVLGALDHQEVPFESLGEELQPIRDMSRTLIFQAMFVLHNLPLIQGARLPGLSMELVEFETNWAKFDLTLSLIEQQGGLEGKLEYNSDVFDASTMERFISHFETLLGSIVENPNQNIARLNLLPERERKLLLEEWKQEGQVNLSANECVHQLIEKQAQMSPHAVAVKFQDSELTYGELNERADRLAHQLRRLGVKANTLVGISVERSPEMVVGILGILKAGGAYLPLDPSYSSERLAFMIQDSKIEILLTQKRLKNKLPTYEGTVVFLDDHLGDIAEVPTTPYSEVGLDDLMYVMYTSGSTGTPKGVMISHRGVMNHNMAVIRRFTLNANDRVLQFASFSFDIAVEEIFPTLIVGGTLVLWKDQFVASGEDFLTWVHEERITVLNLPTAYWHGWVQDLAHIGATLPPSLRLVVVGGEKASTEVYATWSKLAGNQVRWVNTYGPTEATVTATWYENDPNMKGRPIPIGRPIDNVEVYVLDAHMQPVAVGVPGELYIGGPGVAKGYLYRKDLTEERFVPNPFGSRPGERLYKTGDIVRYLSDGNLEYIGRIDSQVKIRGYRIELGEIEVVLEQHPYITQAVVMVREDEPGVKRLTAYIVADSSAVNTTDLRLFLKARLPEYMIPADFVLLEELPLTPNGKVDHKVLPKPEGLTFDTETFVAPRNLFEEMVAQIWSDVLKVKQVGAFDDFFHLGGHSLLATQVISRANETFRISIPLRTIFEYPKLSDWAAQIQKLQSIEQLPPIEKADRNQPLRLSFAQQRLWVLDQLLYNTPLYTMSFAVRVQGSLDVEALEKCLNEIVRRQEVLRTIFAKYEGEAIQQIQEPRYMPLPLFNLTTQDKNTAEEELMRLIQEELERPFDLTKGPLIRFSLVALGEQEHVLLLTMHHIVSDGWSLGILMKELTELYKAYTCGTEPNLPELQIQYADYALHQRNWLQGEVLERQLAYWKKQLSGSPPVLQLPTDKPRPPVQSYRGACEVFKIPNKLTTELKALGHRHGATLFMTLLAAFQALLCRYTGQEDIPVGTPVAGRSRQETEGLIGFFVNTLVLRTDLSGNPTFVELMRRVREVALGAYMHQDVPFELLVEQMVTERSMSHSPLFQVMFALQNTPTTKWEIPNLELSPVGFKTKTSKFDLTLDISETDEGLLCWFEYSTDLFEAETIRRMARHFHNFLEEVVKEPEQPIREVNILDQEERDQLLHEWNRTEMPYGVDETMITQFERQAACQPDAVAVIFEDQSLTYGELNAKANQLARYLQAKGVGRETLVGIKVERSLDMIVGLLGILKAGGAYLPLDPNYPSERVAYILEDAQAPFLLTQAHLLDRLPKSQSEAICLDTDWDAIGKHSIENLPTTAGPEDLAYVIYTSGSTGHPKGVAIRHRNAVALIAWSLSEFSREQLKGVLASTSLCFDLSVFEIFVTLSAGGSVILVENALHLPYLPARNLVTLVNTVPSAIQELLAMNGIPESVRTVNLAGEPLRRHLVDQLYELGHVDKVYNLYGPSEDTTYSTYALVPRDSDRSPTIGRPIANTQLYVLDGYMQPVPIGVTGELYIGGDGLARKYLNRPELTAEKFVPNPFTNGQDRLYRTGDLVRYLPNAELEYLGRLDHQVKIRGFRIELGEIETCLVTVPSVREAVVHVREDVPGDKRLVAYVVPAAENVTPESLTEALHRKLPNYMVPSIFVLLESLPLTPNGKVDRKALPAPDLALMKADDRIRPRTPLEGLVAEVFARVLNVEEVGIHDNFFELGGHSLLATQVVSRLSNSLGISVSLRTLFESPTVAGLAEELQNADEEPAVLESVVSRSYANVKEISLSFSQQRLWILNQLLPDGSIYNIPCMIRLKGKLNLQALESSLNVILERHNILRTTFEEVEGVPVQKVVDPSWTPLEITDIPEPFEKTVDRLAEEEASHVFDLTQGPLVRFRLLRRHEGESVLLFNMHHIVSDGWSLGILMKELTELYKAYTCGTEPNLPELQIQYADYALHQRNWLQGEVLERQLAYWKKQLSGSPPVLQLPTDKPRPPVQSYRGACEVFKIPNKLTTELKALGHRHGATLFMTLLAAFQALLCRYTGQEDIPVGTPVAGRSRQETEGLIGFFVNTLVLRTDLSGNPTFVELMRRVREVALGAYMHQDVPFELLVEQMVTERSMSHSPLFQVMFALQNTPTTKWEIPNLELSPVGFKTKTSKFDLTLDISETDEGLLCWFEYSTDLFEAETIRRMARHFHNFLEEVVKEPEQPIREVNILDQEERDQLLHEWNRTEMPYGVDETMITQFERQAACQPDAVAVIFEDQSLTYGELNAKANQLARYLQAKGVGRETLVGIKVERSLDMIVGLLGILKAGGAYLPLDPNYPSERVAYILEDAQAPFLLTQAHLLDRLPKSQSEAICLDTDWDAIGKHSIENLPTTAGPEDLAYVIYTSGSTGHPKGVAIRHRNAVALIAWSLSEFSREQLKGVLASTSLCFDLSVFEIFVTLSAGGSVILVENALHLPYLPARNLVTLVNTVPSAIQELLAMNGIPESVRTVNLAGEPLRRHLVDQLYELGHVDKVYNLYGPSEDTTYSTYALVPRDSDRSPTIGRPIANTQLYVLDGYMQPVPIGVTGELYIGGDGLACKYLNRPELTAEKFVPNPFTNGQDRLYRTGDLVRYLPNAELEYLGRLDHQVKIRGFRIELGEIETCLVTVPSVREAVVHVREDVPGDKRLVAYVVPAAEKVTPESLTEALHRKLPNYMVPSIFVLLESLPLTPNGKVDRKALPAPERLEAGGAYVAPRDVLEHQLVQIWEDLFGLSPIGIRDNFFNLGGHSLQAVRMISQIEKKMGQSLPLAVLFQAETIEQLAVALRNKTSQKRPAQLVEIQKGTKVPLFLMHPIGGNVFCYGDLAREMGCDQPVYALQAAGLQGETEPLTTIEEMAKRYLDEIRMVQKQEPYRLGGWSMGGLIAYEMAFQLVQQGESVMQLILFDTKLPDPAHRSLTEEELEAWFIQDLAAIAGRDLPASLSKMREEINRLDAAQRRQTWLVQLRKAGLLPPDLTAEGVGHLLRVFKANAYAMATYNPKPLDGLQPILVSTTAVDDNLQHWRRLATGLKVYHAMADHYSLMKKPLIGYILELLQMK